MAHPRLATAPAALLCLALWALSAPAPAQPAAATPGPGFPQTPPEGVGKGHILPTLEGACAVWLDTDKPLTGREEVSWSGGCRNGWADGFGVETRYDDGELVNQFIGHLRQGRWQGLGRLHEHDADGLIAVHEGLFRDDRMEGVFKQLFATDHPLNAPFRARVRQERAGREIGDGYVQVRQFFKRGDLVFLCASPFDCDDQVREQGHSLPRPDPADPLSASLPPGGWRVTLTSETTSAAGRKVVGKPATLGMCMAPDEGIPAQAAHHSVLLFPQIEAWQPYLRAGYGCEDDHVEIKGLTLDWRSTCQAPDDSETVSIRQKRQITDRAFSSETRVLVHKGPQRTTQSLRLSRMQRVGACTADMVRAGKLSF
jgi:hypothetical protein